MKRLARLAGICLLSGCAGGQAASIEAPKCSSVSFVTDTTYGVDEVGASFQAITEHRTCKVLIVAAK